MKTIRTEDVLRRMDNALSMRQGWERLWQECYDYALPSRETAVSNYASVDRRFDKLFDGTAPDAVDQLAASLMSQLTPPFSRWFGFAVGPDVDPIDRPQLGKQLDRAASVLQSHFDRSNFAVEMHQCYLDLVTAGTASLLFEEAPPGASSAFRFTAIPLSQVILEEGPSGRLDASYRRSLIKYDDLRYRFPTYISQNALRVLEDQASSDFPLIESVIPEDNHYVYLAFIENSSNQRGPISIVDPIYFSSSPIINFRWLKAPGETYGRSPVMKALPDIRTANKVVELVLKNASIAVTGIWQAEDDGVINPATIKLVPGTIIPKAAGSSGLTPLQTPGRFDVSQLVLDDLRARIRRALYVDKLGQVNGPRMTATEVLERSAEMARLLGAAYGRLQSELLNPLVDRAKNILMRRGEIEEFNIDGKTLSIQYLSPQSRYYAQQNIQNTLIWLENVRLMGPDALNAVDLSASARWLGTALSVPPELITN